MFRTTRSVGRFHLNRGCEAVQSWLRKRHKHESGSTLVLQVHQRWKISLTDSSSAPPRDPQVKNRCISLKKYVLALSNRPVVQTKRGLILTGFVYIMLPLWSAFLALSLSQAASAPTWQVWDWLDHYTNTHMHQASVSITWSGHVWQLVLSPMTAETPGLLPHAQEIMQYHSGMLSDAFL